MDHEQKTITPGQGINSCRPLIEQSSPKSPQNIPPTLSQPLKVNNAHSDPKQLAELVQKGTTQLEEESKSSQSGCGLNDSKLIIDNKNRMVDQQNDADCQYANQQGISNILDFDMHQQDRFAGEFVTQVAAQKSIHVHSAPNSNIPQQNDCKTLSSPAEADEIRTGSLTRQDAAQTDSGQIYANNPEMTTERKINQFQYFTDQQQIQQEHQALNAQQDINYNPFSAQISLTPIQATSPQPIGFSKSDQENPEPNMYDFNNQDKISEKQVVSEPQEELQNSDDLVTSAAIQQPNIGGDTHQVVQDSQAAVQEEILLTSKAKLQPFEKCIKRQIWDDLYGHLVKTDIEEEKKKVGENMKPPRKPLSPYLFFSQERRKVIKQEKPELNAKQIMRIVSKEWQEISEEKHKEMYEYLSLRDRELYDVLCKFWKQIKNEAMKHGQQLGIPYEPLEGTIAHSVSRRKLVNSAAVVASTSQPNNSSNQIAASGISADSELNIQASIQSNKQDSLGRKKTSKIEKQISKQSQLSGRKRGRTPGWNVTTAAAAQQAKSGKKITPLQAQIQASQPSTLLEQSSDSRVKKRNVKQTAKQNNRKSSEFMYSQDVTTRNNDNDGYDQNEKVRRILEDTKPSQIQEQVEKKPPSYDFPGLDPGYYQGKTANPLYKKQSQRSQRVSADVTHNIGKIPVEHGFLMIPGVQQLKNDNQSRGVVTQSARSEKKGQRMPSNVAQSNMAQENRTSHSDEEEQNQQNQIPYLLKDLDTNKQKAQMHNTDEKKTQQTKNTTNQRVKSNKQMQLIVQNQNINSNADQMQNGAENQQLISQQVIANQTAQKQPNKLADIFGNNEDENDSIIEVDVMINPQSTASQRQAESLIQIQKRPSTHKNMQSSNKIFDIDQNNSANAVRKTEEHLVNTNAEPMESNLGNQNEQQTIQDNLDLAQRNLLPYQSNGVPNQDVIFPFFSDQLMNQMVGNTVQQHQVHQGDQGMSNSHLLLPRVQTNNMGNDMQSTPHFIQQQSRLQAPSNLLNLQPQLSFNGGMIQQSTQGQMVDGLGVSDPMDMILAADHLQMTQSQMQLPGQPNSGQLSNGNLYGNYMPLQLNDSIQPMQRNDSIQRITNMGNGPSLGQMGNNNLLNNVNNNHQGFNDILNNLPVSNLFGLQQNMSNQNGILDLFNVFQNQQAGLGDHNYENDNDAGGNNSK